MKKDMKRILLSLLTIVAVFSIALVGSQAFFSDTETSVGNRFEAGALDLQIDNESYAIDCNVPLHPDFNPEPTCTGELVASAHTSWNLRDLTIEKFFDFIDLKPGDYGEDTISLHIENDAWLCAAARITEDEDNDITEPEDEVFGANNDNNDGTPDGDLDSGLQFAFWVDDGDNVLETCVVDQQECLDFDNETGHIFLSGTLADMGQAGQIALADSNSSILGGNDPIPGGTDFFIGKAWCYGRLSQGPFEQDGLGKTDPNTNGPLVRGTGVNCEGSGEGNIGQTDSVVGDLQFYAEQSRHNDNFLCDENWLPAWPTPTPSP